MTSIEKRFCPVNWSEVTPIRQMRFCPVGFVPSTCAKSQRPPSIEGDSGYQESAVINNIYPPMYSVIGLINRRLIVIVPTLMILLARQQAQRVSVRDWL